MRGKFKFFLNTNSLRFGVYYYFFQSSDLNKKVKIQREKKERTSKPDMKLEKKTNSQKKRSAVAAGISVM